MQYQLSGDLEVKGFKDPTYLWDVSGADEKRDLNGGGFVPRLFLCVCSHCFLSCVSAASHTHTRPEIPDVLVICLLYREATGIRLINTSAVDRPLRQTHCFSVKRCKMKPLCFLSLKTLFVSVEMRAQYLAQPEPVGIRLLFLALTGAKEPDNTLTELEKTDERSPKCLQWNIKCQNDGKWFRKWWCRRKQIERRRFIRQDLIYIYTIHYSTVQYVWPRPCITCTHISFTAMLNKMLYSRWIKCVKYYAFCSFVIPYVETVGQ